MPDSIRAAQRDEPVTPDLSRVGDILEVGNRYYVLASSSLADENEQVLKHDESFAVFDQYGDIKPVGQSEEGLYHLGTRHLSGLLLRLEDERPLLLGSTAKRDNSRLSIDLTNPDMTVHGTLIEHSAVHIARTKVVWGAGCYERVTLRNFARVPVRLRVSLYFTADFVDIFEVRGLQRRSRGKYERPRVDDRSVVLGYQGLDGVRRRTRIGLTPTPNVLQADEAVWDLNLGAGRSVELELSAVCEVGDRRTRPLGFEPALEKSTRRLHAAEERGARLEASSELADEWFSRSIADLVMMTSRTPHGPYPYAGVPWFSTVFGRDGIIAARQALWVMPELAGGVLSFLAATQADEVDPARDAQPGKVVHEIRHGEMAATGEIPFGRYYGSQDATPLFVWLAADYYRHTCDRQLIESIWDNIERALGWMDGPADPDGDGFLDYERKTPSGLMQQGWKDSNDSVFHADGSLADGPIALCEVQGYAYAARRGAAELADALGRSERAAELRAQAESLRQRFEESFWIEELGTYALALDGAKRPCKVRTSNAGHCLTSGIVAPDRAARVADALMVDASFSGWGVRTLAAGQARYNPMSYHNGSIWPHDNAMVALGLARYGFHEAAARIFTGVFDASRHFDLARLPELFCGFSRREGEGPTRYPVACSPQAWASGAPLMMLEACLGLVIDAGGHTLRLDHSRLPLFLDRLRINNLAVGDASIDLMLERQRHGVGVNVLERRGEVEVMTLK